MTCSDKTTLTWMEAPAAGMLNPEPIIANFRKLAKKEGTVDCSVEGIPTRCWNGTDGGLGVYVSHAAAVRGKQLIVVCLRAGGGSGLPRPCESVLKLPVP